MSKDGTAARPVVHPVVYLDGIAFWSPAWPGWQLAAPALRGEAPLDAPLAAPVDAPADAGRPAPHGLAANERRRAPDSVLLALQVAEQAVADSGHAANELASITTSAYGDLPIVDALCRTLAADPLLLSPTRFHHSVHNAASGYWAIASGSRAASSALAADRASFATGLLEAATLCVADRRGVLLVGYDTEARGPLASVTASRGLLGVALVLASEPGSRSRWRLEFELVPGADYMDGMDGQHGPNSALATPVRSAAARSLQANAHADALPLFEALAAERPACVRLALSHTLHLQLQLDPMPADGSAASGSPPAIADL